MQHATNGMQHATCNMRHTAYGVMLAHRCRCPATPLTVHGQTLNQAAARRVQSERYCEYSRGAMRSPNADGGSQGKGAGAAAKGRCARACRAGDAMPHAADAASASSGHLQCSPLCSSVSTSCRASAAVLLDTSDPRRWHRAGHHSFCHTQTN